MIKIIVVEEVEVDLSSLVVAALEAEASEVVAASEVASEAAWAAAEALEATSKIKRINN